MNLEDIVCSIGSAKRLKELGVKQKSIFYYRASENPLAYIFSEAEVPDDGWYVYLGEYKYSQLHDWEMSAFTIQEIVDKLPPSILVEHKNMLLGYHLEIDRFNFVADLEKITILPCWVVNYKCSDYWNNEETQTFESLGPHLFKKIYMANGAEAFAQALIRLIEDKRIPVDGR